MLMTPKDNIESTNRSKKKGDEGEDSEEETARLLTEDPLDLILKNEHVGDMLSDVQDRDLPNKLISMVHDMNYKASDTDCVMLLLCKLKPFVWSMQKAINERIAGDVKAQVNNSKSSAYVDRISIFFKYVPSLEEFKNNGAECEDIYETCKLF